MALTKAELAEKLFEELGLNKREAKELVEMFFEEIRLALENGSQVKKLDSATSIYAIKTNAPAVILRPVKKFRLLRAGL